MIARSGVTAGISMILLSSSFRSSRVYVVDWFRAVKTSSALHSGAEDDSNLAISWNDKKKKHFTSSDEF